ncbi:MAG: thioredoxin fold domain-containing protein [Planctomycetota bacterium]
MEIKIFSKNTCPACNALKNSIDQFFSNFDSTSNIKVIYYNIEEEEGIAEGAFLDVRSVPTTIVEHERKQLARWDGIVPNIDEFASHLKV